MRPLSGTTIRIEKYDDYQGVGTAKGTFKGQPKDSRGTAKGQLKSGTAKSVEISSVSGSLGTTEGQQKDSKRTEEGQHLPTYKKIKKNTSYSKEEEEDGVPAAGATSGVETPSSAPAKVPLANERGTWYAERAR